MRILINRPEIMTDNSLRETKRVVVWDLPTRLFHWFLAFGFMGAYLTSENDQLLYTHVYLGYVFLFLLLFRFIWGVVGSRYARFHAFAYNWPSVSAYLKGLLNGDASRHIGHNPAGSWAIFAILFLGLAISLTGLMVLGGEEQHGILKSIVSYEVGSFAKEVHEIFASLMLLLVFLHVSGVIVESVFHNENLVWSMISGKKETSEKSEGVKVFNLVGAALVIAILVSAVFTFRGYVLETEEDLFRPFVSEPLPTNATWSEECGDCHLAFHPSLLPERSWQKIMADQTSHFDEDLDLDEETVAEILQFLINNSAEKGLTEAANKISRSVAINETPISIAEIKYWKEKHRDIEDVYWKSKEVMSKNNCGACHLDAKDGWFEDSNMRLPKLK